MDAAVILEKIHCIRTSRGLGRDDVYIVTELWDNKNTNRQLLKRTLSHIGNMGNGDTRTERDDPNLSTPGDQKNFLLWIPKPGFGIDSLECNMIVLKANFYTSYATGPNDPADTNDEAQKAEQDVLDGLKKELDSALQQAQDELKDLQQQLNQASSAVSTATGTVAQNLQGEIANLKTSITKVQNRISRLKSLLARLNKGLGLAGEVLTTIIDIVSLIWHWKGSWGETVALGTDWWQVVPPAVPVVNVTDFYPSTGSRPRLVECSGADGLYNVEYRIRLTVP